MKKYILSFLLASCIIAPALADNTNSIRNLTKNTSAITNTKQNDLEIVDINTNISVRYIDNNKNSKYLDYADNYYKITFLNEKGKTIKKTNVKSTHNDGMYGDILDFDLSKIPNETVKYSIVPKKDYEQIQDKSQLIRKRLNVIKTELDFILENGYYEYDEEQGIHTYYAEYSDLVHKVLEPGLAELGNRYNNGFLLDNGNIFIVSIDKLPSDLCNVNPEKPNTRTACGIITVDINGLEPPNKKISPSFIKDRYRFLIYPTKVLLYPGDEYDFYYNTANYRSLDENINSEILLEYWDYAKNLIVEDTATNMFISVANYSDKTVDEQSVEIKFYDSDNKEIDNWIINIPVLSNSISVIEKELDFSTLDKRIKSYSINLLKEVQKANMEFDSMGMKFLDKE